jgi:CheY-like chemotaxis protein
MRKTSLHRFTKEDIMGEFTSGFFMGDQATNGRILVVDDEADIRKVVRMTLQKAGYDVLEAENGERAIETINSGEYKPLSRPLFIYVKETSLKRPEVGQFVKFYLEQTPQLIADVGYVAAPQDDYTQGLAKLQPFLASS